ncbi:MAG TPA: SMP-30/gluconolactonase/LRE family protein [Polyangia bacterium]|nr:SMP-30/gluconolactonase/LRE family protein [Polyangia bacterium]
MLYFRRSTFSFLTNMIGAVALTGAFAACSSSSSSSNDAGGGGGNDGGATDAGSPLAGPVLGTATEISQTTYTFVSLEGPYWVAGATGATGYLLFSDVVEKNAVGAKIYKYDPGTNAFSVYPFPGATPTSTNGLGMDSMGRLVATERYNARVTRVEKDGTLTVLASMYPAAGGAGTDAGADAGAADGGADDGGAEAGAAGTTFNAPNDLTIDTMDNIYFSDTRWGSIKPDAMLAKNAAYRIGADGSLAQLYVAGTDPTMSSVNGIALSLDHMWLYLGDDIQNKLLKLPLDTNGLVPMGATPTVMADSTKVPGFSIPDGITLDDDGNLYVAMNDHRVNAIAVLAPDGTYKGRYDVPVGIDLFPDGGPQDPGGKGPSNISFGGADRKTLYITTLHGIWKVAVTTAGKP